MSDADDTLDKLTDDVEEEEFPSDDRKRYEKKYGRETAEEEMEAILEDATTESREISHLLSVSSNILDNIEQVSLMGDVDRKPSLSLLHGFAMETKFNKEVLELSTEASDDFVFSEGLVASIVNWASSAVSASFKVMGYALKRGAIFVSRTRKDADQLESRLTKLDSLMKSRKSEKNRIFFDKSKLAMFVEEYDLNTTPASSISTFVGAIYSIIDKKMDMLRKITSKAESDLTSSGKIDIKSYKEIVDDLIDDLSKSYGKDTEFIGNKWIKVNESAKIDKLITFETSRPDPKTVISKFRPMDALSNSEVESQRTSLRSGSIKKMYRMMDETSEDLKKISEFNKAHSAKKKDSDQEPDKKDVAELGKFLNEHIEPTITSIMNLAKYAYDLVDANVSLLEDSVTVTKIIEDEEPSEVEGRIGKNLSGTRRVDN